ncbi:GNAT family N-acetyltransferase [Pontibacter arcticus]|uniref:GNAT family N-acetyltransferase n=1 Tax=Pontibacter arcticus TaxID=2080288 RepID=UPI001A9E8B5F|nr:GNAT family N-acetyltransferase [Pontibacter arcticus]
MQRESMYVIGDAGFKGKPTGNTIDIGYAIIEKKQGKGYGFEAAKGLLNWAMAQESVHDVTAKCLIDNIASAKILRKLGLNEISRDKKMIYWRITKSVYTS